MYVYFYVYSGIFYCVEAYFKCKVLRKINKFDAINIYFNFPMKMSKTGFRN